MTSHQQNLDRYLEIETILNDFFSDFNYCMDSCLKKEYQGNFPSCGCCKDKYYKKYDLEHPAFGLLKKNREILYGKPGPIKYVKRISPCEYHTLSGCVLKTHKSPICLSFLCRESIDYLRERHNIYEYDYLGIHYALEWILTGELSEVQFKEFKDICLKMVEEIKSATI